MTAITAALNSFRGARIDGAWVAIALILLLVAILTPADFPDTVTKALGSLLHTAPYIIFAVLATGYLKATGCETLLAKAFEGKEWRMIVMASLAGGLSPFCSCEVIPFIAALLALGAPLSGIMAFWLSSPLMDPPMFAITTGAIGLDFAVAKTIAAVGLGLFGGIGVKMIAGNWNLADQLKPRASGGCCGAAKPFGGRPVWKFWGDAERRASFWAVIAENGPFLLKWLALAYVLEALMVRHVPAESVATLLGGEGLQPVLLGALVGGPAYLNGYAAAPLIGGLLEQGMSPGAAMSFALAGGVSCIPAAIAVWALVKVRIFALYLGFAFVGSILAGLAYAAYV